WAFERAFRSNLFAVEAKRIFTSIPNAPSIFKEIFELIYKKQKPPKWEAFAFII
ncbi:MAG: hypothetical protein JWQ25_956, partial [Daejeonella sp.]|nr:hypothetical protein [Daejeonella sp.]